MIPARNAAETIERQLAAVARQDYTGDLELIVANNGSEDDTVERASRWGVALDLRVIDVLGAQSVARARNAGIAIARHPFVLVCDADDVIDVAWVGTLANALEDADVVAGGTVDWNGRELPIGSEPQPAGGGGFGFLPTLGGCSFALRRQVWSELGGFDEELRSCEDIDFAWRAQLAGYRLRSAPSGFVYYRIPQRPTDVFRKWFSYGLYQPAVFRRHRGAGLGRQPLYRAASRWAKLLLTSYRLLGPSGARRDWYQEAGRRVGRIIGSFRFRALYL